MPSTPTRPPLNPGKLALLRKLAAGEDFSTGDIEAAGLPFELFLRMAQADPAVLAKNAAAALEASNAS